MNFYKICHPVRFGKTLVFFFIFSLIGLYNTKLYGQTPDSSQKTEIVTKDSSAEANKAIKMVFKELKKDDSILPTLGMIAVVFVIVAVAMYISFKYSDTKKSKA